MTAQHTVAGIKSDDMDFIVDYQYRLARESERQIGVYINSPINTNKGFNPLYEMSLIKQPICYVVN